MITSTHKTWKNTRQVAGLLWRQADRRIKLKLAWVLLLIVATSTLAALAPVALKWIVDGFSGAPTGPQVSATLLVGLYVLSQWVGRLIGEVRSLAYAHAERRMYRRLSEALFSHVLDLPLRFHLGRRTGALTQTLANGLVGSQMILQQSVFTVLPVVLELAAVGVVLMQLHHGMFLGLFSIALTCYAIAFGRGVVRIAEPANAASAAQVDANAVMTDGLLNYETVKYFTAETVLRERFDRSLGKIETHWLRFFRRKTINGIGVATVFGVFLAATLCYAAYEVQRGGMSVGDFVLVNAYVLQVVRPVEMLGLAMQQFSQGFAFSADMLKLFDEKPEPRQRPEKSLASGAGRVEFDRVCLSYSANQPVMREVSFAVVPGTTLGIVGASGAGKSSLVRLLMRLVEPDGGRILLDATPIADLPLSQLRQAIAVVPQDTMLFNDTIAYNIGFGKPGSSQLDIENAAKLAHLHDFIVSLPDGYGTCVGERGLKLSGGERQRISIARAVLKRPRIYVFDEATSSLDTHTERHILRSLLDIAGASTTLIIAHRLSTVVHADAIIVMERGEIAERGTHESLLAAAGRYAGLWRAQQFAGEIPAADKRLSAAGEGNHSG